MVCRLVCTDMTCPHSLIPSSARDALDGSRSSESATLPENVNQAIEEVRNPVGGGGGVLPLFAVLACSTSSSVSPGYLKFLEIALEKFVYSWET